ncbi:hypothetical protein P3S67_011660 [Capsicum chacoense]
MLAGGTDTTVVELTWTLSLLLNNPHVMQKVQAELDIQVGKDTLVNESHIKNLVYLRAIVKESLRLYPPAPLLAPHESVEDCTVGGYNIPKGTRVLFNSGNHFELIPFGAGRRICPGISSALVLLLLTLANVLHAFEIIRPSDELIDMTESFGMTNLKATPLEVLVAPRLSQDLYNYI